MWGLLTEACGCGARQPRSALGLLGLDLPLPLSRTLAGFLKACMKIPAEDAAAEEKEAGAVSRVASMRVASLVRLTKLMIAVAVPLHWPVMTRLVHHRCASHRFDLRFSVFAETLHHLAKSWRSASERIRMADGFIQPG